MDYKRLSTKLRNQNIENISVVLNTLDVINFPNIHSLCQSDIDRFKMINIIQKNFGDTQIDKEMIYKFCISFEENN
jgi:hypothetical protein